MSKEEAIKICKQVRKYFKGGKLATDDTDAIYEALSMAIEALKEQKTGEWIIFPPCIEEICMCSNCKTKFKEAYQHRDTCPSCGARMEVE